MKSCEKMLTYEEWKQTAYSIIRFKELFDAARQGMMPIPESNDPDIWAATSAIHKDLSLRATLGDVRLIWQAAQAALLADPMVIDLRGLEWPDDSMKIRLMFVDKSDNDFRFVDNIIRPTPSWHPKEGEAVFIVRGDNTDVSVVRFSHIDQHGIWRVITVKGQEQGFTPSLVKPFDPAKIGKPWEEI